MKGLISCVFTNMNLADRAVSIGKIRKAYLADDFIIDMLECYGMAIYDVPGQKSKDRIRGERPISPGPDRTLSMFEIESFPWNPD